MLERLELYPYKVKCFERISKKLHHANISAINKKLIRDFQNYLFSNSSKAKRVTKLTSELLAILRFRENDQLIINCDLNNVTKHHILSLISFVNRLDKYSEATKADYRRVIKQFYAWHKEEDQRLDSEERETRTQANKLYDHIKNNISISYKKKQIDPTSILTDDDIESVATKGCRSIKEKAFIKFLHETGVRAGEMLNLRIKDIEIKKNIGIAYVDGKTGRRTVHFTKSMSYVVQWLGIHPMRENLNSFVWLGERSNNLYQPLRHRGSQKLIDRCFERAGYIKKEYLEANLESGKIVKKLVKTERKKKSNMHWFRHSRASLLAPHLPESLLCRYMGWTLGSKQVRNYVHLCPQQLEDAYLKMHGLAEDKKKENLPQKCGCSAINDSFARYCFQCGNPLSVDIAIQDQELIKSETSKAIKEMMEMAKNQELMEAFTKFKQQFVSGVK